MIHRQALLAGAADEGAPGSRPHYGEAYYGCFVRDLDGAQDLKPASGMRESSLKKRGIYMLNKNTVIKPALYESNVLCSNSKIRK
ncbi:hypothetical protein M8494_09270 [Serratia ureilytica]